MTSPQAGGITPAYGLRYITEGQPAKYTRQYLQQNVETIEAALLAGGVVPPGAADLNAVTARVAALETKVAPRLDIYRGTTNSYSGGPFAVNYDQVRTTETTPALTSLDNAWFTVDMLSGRRVKVKQAGLYQLEASARTTAGADSSQFLQLYKMPTANTRGTLIEGFGPGLYGLRVVATVRLAANEYVGVWLTSTGSDTTDDPAAGTRNHLTITRLSA